MIQSDATAQAEGLCIVGLSDEDYAKLDYYEGAFGYSLKPVQLFDGTKAQVYFPPPATWTAQDTWNFDQWAAEWGQISILSAKEVIGRPSGSRSRNVISRWIRVASGVAN